MSTPSEAPAPGVYEGKLEVKEPVDGRSEFTGTLVATRPASGAPPTVAVYLRAGPRTFGVELRPDGDGWRGEESRRVPHRFDLSLEGRRTEGSPAEFRVSGRLHTPDTDGEGVRVTGRFPLGLPAESPDAADAEDARAQATSEVT